MACDEASTGPRASATWPEAVIGAKYVRLLEGYLSSLRDEDAHGNQKLFLDDVFVMYLLAFFNPSVRSLRTVEDLSQTRQAQRYVSVPRVCRSTLSDFNQLADPDRLKPIVETLQRELSKKSLQRDFGCRDLHDLLKRTIAVDGTFLPAVAEVAWAVANSNNHGAVRHRARLDTHLHVTTWLPEVITVPEPNQSEAASAAGHISPGRIYVYDRGYMSFDLIRAHYESSARNGDVSEDDESVDAVRKREAISDFVIRYKPAGGNSPELKNAVERPLTEEDQVAGVISDRVGHFHSAHARRAGIQNRKLREVIIHYEDKGEQKTLRLITSLMDVAAKTIGLLFRFRWQVELFFRWFKSFGHFGHLISHCREGVLTHLYVTIIAMLLMYLHTGYRPSKYMFALLNQVAAGSATLEEIIPILRERERRCELDRKSRTRRAAKKQS